MKGWDREPGYRQGSLIFPGGVEGGPESARPSGGVPPAPAGTRLVLDLETKVGFDQIRGRSGIRDMGISVAVTYAYADETYRTYFEDDVPSLVDDLFTASEIIGFNIRRFDLEVVRGYTRRRLGRLPTLDLLDDIERAAGHRVSLASLLQETLGTSKAGDGRMAIAWYRKGDWASLEEYCREDVRATKALYEHGRSTGSVSFWDRRKRGRRSVPVHW